MAISQDEAAVLGSVLYAAQLSSTIRGAEFKTKDVAPYGVIATTKITRPSDQIDADEEHQDETIVPRKDDDEDEYDDDEDDDYDGSSRDQVCRPEYEHWVVYS